VIGRSKKMRFKAQILQLCFLVTNLLHVVFDVWKQRRLMCAAKKAIGKMPLRTLRSGDEVCFTAYQLTYS